MIRSYLGFDLTEHHNPKMLQGILYGSLGACAEALPWFLAAFGMPYVLEGGEGTLAGMVALVLAGVGFMLGTVLKAQAFNANFDAAYTMVAQTRLRLADHLARLPLGRVLAQRDGAWAELLTTHFGIYQEIVTNFWGYVVAGTAFPVLLSLLLLWLHWGSALIVLASLPLACLTVPLSYRLMDRAADAIASTRQTAAVNVLEVISGLRDLRFFDPRGQRRQASLDSLVRFRDESMRTEVAPAPALMMFSLIIYLGAALAIGAATLQFVAGGESASTYFMGMLITLRLATAINEFGPYLTVMRFAASIINRIRAVLDEPVMPQVAEGQQPKDGSIEVSNVYFGYNTEEVLHDISLKGESGSMLALVGPSGSGKSTLAALLARLWDVNQGAVRIGAVDVRDMDEATLHRTVSMVLQDVVLFPMTVADNIRLGRSGAQMDEVVEAARGACIHERILELPKGYDTTLESDEVVLSGGERQRVAIARAILKDAPVLILDEATASLDLDNETAVQQALTNLCRGKTTVVIAHRLWTVQNADKIIVLEQGKVIE